MDDDPEPTVYPTRTSDDQEECEQSCAMHYQDWGSLPPAQQARLRNHGLLSDELEVKLMRDKHIGYLINGLVQLSGNYVVLDASRPWLCYWILHSLDLLDALPHELAPNAIDTLKRCEAKGALGGYGGGPMQHPHCAPTYAAVLALCLLGSAQAYGSIDRRRLYRFFWSLKHASGGFRMHEDGEVDVRGTYTVVAIAALTNMLTPELVSGVAEYTRQCQTYEGGFGGEPGTEAHGGYAFCALAALVLLGEAHTVDLRALEEWCCHRQMEVEGGFSGRCNKLVDSCYSFWQGGTALLLEHIRRGRVSLGPPSAADAAASAPVWTVGTAHVPPAAAASAPVSRPCGVADSAWRDGYLPVDQLALQKYILLCAQQFPDGGLRDKPGKPRDYYHTCYSLSGLSAMQNFLGERITTWGDAEGNIVAPTHPAFNIRETKVADAFAYFGEMPCDHESLMA